MQRRGRKGHPTYRMVVQDSRTSPTSGKVIAYLGSYDPHSKEINLVKDKTEHFLKNGAQPSDRVVRLLVQEKVDLPKWVKQPVNKERSVRKPEKLRKNRPAEEVKEEPKAEEPAEAEPEAAKAEVSDEKPVEEAPVSDAPNEETEPAKDPAEKSAE